MWLNSSVKALHFIMYSIHQNCFEVTTSWCEGRFKIFQKICPHSEVNPCHSHVHFPSPGDLDASLAQPNPNRFLDPHSAHLPLS